MCLVYIQAVQSRYIQSYVCLSIYEFVRCLSGTLFSFFFSLSPGTSVVTATTSAVSSLASGGITSIFSLIGRWTVTPLGMRRLFTCMSQPLVDPQQIERRYDIVGIFQNVSTKKPNASGREPISFLLSLPVLSLSHLAHLPGWGVRLSLGMVKPVHTHVKLGCTYMCLSLLPLYLSVRSSLLASIYLLVYLRALRLPSAHVLLS